MSDYSNISVNLNIMETRIQGGLCIMNDLTFDSTKWEYRDFYVKWDDDFKDYKWVGMGGPNGEKINFEWSFKYNRNNWFFFQRWTLVESFNSEKWFLLEINGMILMEFDEYPSDPTDFPDAQLSDFSHDIKEMVGEKFNKLYSGLNSTQDLYYDLTYCIEFWKICEDRDLIEHNFGYQIEQINLEDGSVKYRFSDNYDYWASCQFENLSTSWNLCGVGVKSLNFDQIDRYHSDGTCFVRINEKFAVINRWFYRISPWFDEVIDLRNLNNLLNNGIQTPQNCLCVRIGDEIQILEFDGNFISDMYLNTLVFFKDKQHAKDLILSEFKNEYHSQINEIIVELNANNNQDDINRVFIDEEYHSLLHYPDNIPLWTGMLNYKFEFSQDMAVLVKKHNSSMGIAFSGYRVLNKYTL